MILKPLTSFRFFFALMVFVSHLSFLGNSNSESLKFLYNSVFKEGFIGVSFFFILSGFILTHTYQHRFSEKNHSKKSFYIARFAKVVPLHLFTFLLAIPLTLGLFAQNKTTWMLQAITNLSLTHSFVPIPSYYFSFNAPVWSLSDEVFFYLLFPFLITLIGKSSDFTRYPNLIFLAIIPVLAYLVPAELSHQLFYINPLTRIFDFILGIITYNAYSKIQNENLKINPNWLEFSSIILFSVFFCLHEQVPIVARYSFYYWIPMCFLLYSFAFQRGRISKFLSGKTFLHLGNLSFGFYLFHYLVLKYFNIINFKFLTISNEIAISLLVFFISLIASHFSFVWLEVPAKNRLKKLLNPKKQSE